MTPQELKNSILQLAIQGKLVEQRPEEGTAAELLEKIARHGTTGTRGTTKTTRTTRTKSRAAHRASSVPSVSSVSSVPVVPSVPDDEKPFDIPESWEWVRLGDISSQITKGTTPRGGNVSYSDKGVGFLRAENIAGLDVLDKSNLKYIDEKIHLGALRRSILEANDILITIAGTLGRTAIVRDNDLPLNANQAVSMIRLVDAKSVSLKYIVIALNSPMIQRILTKQRKVTAIPNLTLEIIGDCLIPLPPLAEQKRIVTKIEELLPLVDRYEKAWSKLEDFNKRFPVDMQKSLLQMAIQGKLVEQRPEEGTGEELYRQIQAEKQRLIKSGKIKKEKPLPEISEDEIPFDIPDSWKWVRLSQIAKAIVDCPHSTPKYLNRETEYCTIDTNCINEKGEIIKWRYVDAGTYQVRIARLVPQKDDIVYTREGSICRAAQLPDNKNICLGQRVMLVRCAHGMFPQFLRRMLMSPAVIIKLTEQQKGIGAKHVNVSDVCNLLIPLPPLAEQKRIVAKLEELLPLCERLKFPRRSLSNP